jgi:hypothetical protein
MSSFSLFDVCKLRKLLPGSRLFTFLVQHYYQQRHVSWQGVFATDEGVQRATNAPVCWAPLMAEYQNRTWAD